MIWQLVVKEIREHLWVGIGVAVLAFAQYIAFIELSLRDEPPTALTAATNFIWGTGPVICAFTARRVFVLEQENRTIQLLRSLPMSPATITMTKFVLGLVYSLLLNLAVLWITAWALREQEILTSDWMARLSMLAAIYLFAWFGLACFHAQLGGYRFAVWLIFFTALLGFQDVLDNPSRHLFWTAPLADNIETTRYSTPWDAVAIGLAWGIGATAAAVGLATYRGGAVVDDWFTPMSGRRRAVVTGLTILTLIVLEVAANAIGRHPGLASPGPDEPRLHTADARLRPMVTRLSTVLEDMRKAYDIDSFPRALFRVRHDLRPEPVLTTALRSGELIVSVRPKIPPNEALRLALTDVLVGHSGAHWERVDHVGVWAAGFAPYWLKDESLGPTAARLEETPPEMLATYDSLRQRFGRRGVEAAGWLGWVALEQIGGPGAVKALAQTVFGVPFSQTGAGLVAARAVNPRAAIAAAGVDLEAFDRAWVALVMAQRKKHGPLPTWSLPPVKLERQIDAPPALGWQGVALDLEAVQVELWWSVADNLHPVAVPQSELHALPVRDAEGWIPALIDPRDRIVATWVVNGEVQGWAEVERR